MFKLKSWQKWAIIGFIIPIIAFFLDGFPTEEIWTALVFPFCFIATGGGHPPACILTGLLMPFVYAIVFGFIGYFLTKNDKKKVK